MFSADLVEQILIRNYSWFPQVAASAKTFKEVICGVARGCLGSLYRFASSDGFCLRTKNLGVNQLVMGHT